MKINRRWISGGLTAAALAAVVTGTALAQSSTPPAPAESQADQPGGTVENEADEQEPMLNGSLTVADDESLSEEDEAAQLAQLDVISEADAIAAATADGGSADAAELGNENGTVVYEVEVTGADGTASEVKVDAGNGDVLATEDEEADDDENEDDDEGEVEDEAADAGDGGEETSTAP